MKGNKRGKVQSPAPLIPVDCEDSGSGGLDVPGVKYFQVAERPDIFLGERDDGHGFAIASDEFDLERFIPLVGVDHGTDVVFFGAAFWDVLGAITEKYLWEGLTRLLAVCDGSENLLMRFEYADGRMPVAMTSGGVRYYFACDPVGTLRAVVDGSGTVVKRVDYDSFGNVITDTTPGFAVPFGFAGGFYDLDTGLVRFGYRDYDPDTGRWTAKDPILFAGGDYDLYGYVFNDPVNLIDPTGAILYQVAVLLATGPYVMYQMSIYAYCRLLPYFPAIYPSLVSMIQRGSSGQSKAIRDAVVDYYEELRDYYRDQFHDPNSDPQDPHDPDVDPSKSPCP